MQRTDAMDATEAGQQLARILGSRAFAKAQRSQAFLRYLVEAAVAEPPMVVKEYTIAIDVFGCAPSYNPSVDATVRVEAGRLRTRLHEYYAAEGRDDRWVVDVPKGGYRATFMARQMLAQERPMREMPARTGLEGTAPDEPAIAGEAAVAVPDDGSTRRRVSRRLLSGVAAGLLVLVAAFAAGMWRSRPTHATRGTGGRVAITLQPFENLTTDPGNTARARLMTGDLERQFSDVPSLEVLRPRATAGRGSPGAVDGRAMLLAGTLRRDADEHIALALQLSRAGDGVILLDRQYLLEGPDLRSVQADIFNDVIRTLHVEPERDVIGGGSAAQPIPPAMLDAFNRARAAIDEGTPEGLHSAVQMLEPVVAKGPRFARAWAGLAEAHTLLGLYFEPPREHMQQARVAAEHAIALDPSLQAAHGTLGIVHLFYDWDYQAAQAEVANAEAEDSAIHRLACFSHLLERTGNPRHGEEEILRLLAFDPRSAALIGELGCIDYYRGDYTGAVARYRQALATDAHSPMPTWGLGKSLAQQGRYAEALSVLQAFRKANGMEPPLITSEIGYVEGRSGHAREAHATIARLKAEARTVFVDPYLIALVYHGLGDDDASYRYLGQAYEIRSTFLISLTTEPKWQNARKDPRFSSLMARMSSAVADRARQS